MTEHEDDQDFDADEQVMADDVELGDDDDFLEEVEDIPEENERKTNRSRIFNMEVRQRIEEKLEQRRLEKELDFYDFDDI